MATPVVDTLLELYESSEPILNVAGAWHLQPRNIIFFYYELEDPAAERKQLAQMFNKIGLRCGVRMEKLERLNIQDMLDWVQEHQHELGDYAIELTGGDDEMLFSAGCSYMRFPCKLFLCKPDGRYIALPSGEVIKPGKGVFSVAERLLLNDATLDHYGRLTPAELKPAMLSLAARLIDLQEKHPYQWSDLTTCIQQCVSRAEEGALTVMLDWPTCRETNVSNGKGKLLPALVRAGALTEVVDTSEGIRVTFPSELIRDCLCDFGVWLEITVYDAMRACGKFDDVQLSCVVRWENEKLINELDVVGTAGLGLMIVSCKTCAPDLKAVAELNVLGDRLGSSHTETVLVSLPKGRERLDNIAARCDEMGVRLVDLRQHDRDSLINYFTREGTRLHAGRKD